MPTRVGRRCWGRIRQTGTSHAGPNRVGRDSVHSVDGVSRSQLLTESKNVTKSTRGLDHLNRVRFDTVHILERLHRGRRCTGISREMLGNYTAVEDKSSVCRLSVLGKLAVLFERFSGRIEGVARESLTV
jgi:hypothetical protein